MVLLVDNYDSFTYNLYQYFRALEEKTIVVRNDSLDTKYIRELNPELIALSPGPGRPSGAGKCIQIIEAFASEIPIFGICLGMQAIAEAYGGRVVRAKEPVHGKTRPVRHGGVGLFWGLPNPLRVTRYHSLVIDPKSLPSVLEATAWSEEDEIMALAHREYPVFGVQFHPEAHMTEKGLDLMGNALALAKGAAC